MSTTERLRAIVEPVLAERGLELYDLEHPGGQVRVLVEGPEPVDLDELGRLTRVLSLALDEHDPIPGRYTLEVSSPGLERPLRTPRHFVRAVGEEVTVKARVEVDGQRRFTGTLAGADDDGIVIEVDGGTTVALRYADIDKARTVFSWGPAPKPGSRAGRTNRSKDEQRDPQQRKNKRSTTAKAASS